MLHVTLDLNTIEQLLELPLEEKLLNDLELEQNNLYHIIILCVNCLVYHVLLNSTLAFLVSLLADNPLTNFFYITFSASVIITIC